MATADELRSTLGEIEHEIDSGSYVPGRWQRWLRDARALPDAERARLTTDVSRISNKLHQRKYSRTVSFQAALIAELAATVAGFVVLGIGLNHGSSLLVILAAAILATTFQPLVKIACGAALGIGYEYTYLFGVEPRFKMRYGSYLAAPRWARVLLHLSGMVGSPLALWIVERLAYPDLTLAWVVCDVAFWVIVLTNTIALICGFARIRKLYRMVVSVTSGGVAGMELREALGE